MKSMLVTGGCGFIGANYIRFLLEESDFPGRIINVDKLTYAGNPDNLSRLKDEYQDRYIFIKADICDRQKMREVLVEYRIDSICHFAAESHVDRSIASPDAFIQSNIIGTFNLLEIARELQDRIEIFHHISTDEVFGSLDEEGYFTEETPYRPNSPYSASKASSDHLVRAFHKTYKLPVTISNCSNNYGPYQFPEKMIPLMILNAVEGKSLPVYGDGRNVRDWLYVKDHCRAVWMIMKDGRVGEIYNIGGNNEIENIRLVEIICDAVDNISPKEIVASSRELISFVKDRPGHDLRYAIDFSKLKNELGWYPEETFETGLDKTVRWYLDNQGWVENVKSGQYQSWVREHYG